MVGPDGSVVGVEQDPARSPWPCSVGTGSASAMSIFASVTRAHSSMRNRSTPLSAGFCWCTCPALSTSLRTLYSLRPGGVFIAVDYDVAGVRALPEVELYSRLTKWIRAGFEYVHAECSSGCASRCSSRGGLP